MQMKDQDLLIWAALTADQRHSRRSPDQVPDALARLEALSDRFVLGFERTAGDEIQGLTDKPEAVVDAVLTLSRSPDWHVGIGLGTVDLPLPGSTREARGPAYLAARTAVEQAELQKVGADDAARTAIEAQQKAWRDTAARWESEPATGEGRKELAERAKAAEGVRERSMAKYHLFEYSSAALQVAIVVASASIITGVPLLALLGVGLGLVAGVLGGIGWLAPSPTTLSPRGSPLPRSSGCVTRTVPGACSRPSSIICLTIRT